LQHRFFDPGNALVQPFDMLFLYPGNQLIGRMLIQVCRLVRGHTFEFAQFHRSSRRARIEAFETHQQRAALAHQVEPPPQ
jgi:hypothetical protein